MPKSMIRMSRIITRYRGGLVLSQVLQFWVFVVRPSIVGRSGILPVYATLEPLTVSERTRDSRNDCIGYRSG
jgi:hypothetical protein